ncbi:MAG: hypothetical protein HY287_02445 [Planctomycetes bacterium]|nr:hypothetical protein [Planctomycetota bacterium]MBI3833169.1 hypothetical protein [Planctomycetota bacterium]
MTEPILPRTRLTLTFNQKISYALGAGAVTVLTIILLFSMYSRVAPPGVPVPAISDTALSPAGPAQVSVDGGEQQRQAFAKAQLQRLVEEGKEITRVLKEAEAQLALWAKEIEPELLGPRGKSLAADPAAVERFHAVYTQPRAKPEEIAACRSRLDTVVRPAEITLAGGASAYVPDPAVMQMLDKEKAIAEDLLRSAREAHESAIALLNKAAQTKAVGTQTLSDALTSIEQTRAAQRAETILEKQKAAYQQATEKIADAKATQTKALAEQEASNIEAETRRKIASMQTDQQTKDADSEQQHLRTLAARPDIQAKYRPFLDKGRLRPNRENLEKPGPMSFAQLKADGVLNNHRLFGLAGAGWWPTYAFADPQERGNDRIRWKKPKTDEDFDTYKPLYEEFMRLAPFWVETGVLAP